MSLGIWVPSDFVLVDTNYWYALLDCKQERHTEAVRMIAESSAPLATTNYIINELVECINEQNLSIDVVYFFWDLWTGNIARVIRITPECEMLAWKLYLQVQNTELSFTDCTSLVLLAKFAMANFLTFDESLAMFFDQQRHALAKWLQAIVADRPPGHVSAEK